MDEVLEGVLNHIISNGPLPEGVSNLETGLIEDLVKTKTATVKSQDIAGWKGSPYSFLQSYDGKVAMYLPEKYVTFEYKNEKQFIGYDYTWFVMLEIEDLRNIVDELKPYLKINTNF
jgi:hypothetical protein